MSLLAKLLVVLLGLTSLISAVPTELSKRQGQSEHCNPQDQFQAGAFTMWVNSWGLKSGVQGQSCLKVTHVSGNTIGFNNHWDWKPNGGVKSFSHANLDVGKQLSGITRVPTNLNWNIKTGKSVYSLGWDIFTGSSPGAIQNEIMLWLDARGGAAPLAYNYDNNGPIPTAKGLNLAGHTWTLYIGTNGSQKVYSFVANTLPLKQVNGDLNDFFKYLTCQGTQNCLK